MRLKDINDRIERSQAADRFAGISDIGLIAKAWAMSQVNQRPPAAMAEAIKAPPDVVAVMKAAVGSVSLADLPAFGPMVATFIASLRSRSVFARLLAEGMREAPLQTPVRAVSVAVTGTVHSEGHPAPISRMVLTSPLLPRLQAIALVALTREVVNGTSPEALSLLETEMKNSVSAAIDGPFLSIVSSGAPSVASTGDDADAALIDLRALLAQVNTTGAGALFWVLSPDVANRAAALSGVAGTLLFPEVSPTGGFLLKLPALVSNQVPAGQLHLIDAAGLVGNIDTVNITSSEHASLRMRDDPENVAAELVSLWQTGGVAFRATIGFGVERFRAGAVARLTGVTWGDGVPNS